MESKFAHSIAVSSCFFSYCLAGGIEPIPACTQHGPEEDASSIDL
jgi:hypothetical protein